MKESNLQNIQKLAKMLDGHQMVTTEEFKSAVSDFINAFAQHRSAFGEISKKNEESMATALRNLQSEFDAIRSDVKTETGMTKEEMKGMMAKCMSDMQDMCDEMESRLPKDGLDGLDADEEKIIQEVLAKIKLPENKVISPEETRDMLSSLKGEERLDITSIKGWTNIIDNLANRAQQSFTSGISYLNRLVDVNLSSPTNGQVLTYNSTTQKWYNSTAAGGGDMVLANVQTNSGAKTFLNNTLLQRNPANTFSYTIAGGAIVADRILNLPVLTGTDTIATLGLSQTWGNNQTFSGTSGGAMVTISNAGAGVGLNVDDITATNIINTNNAITATANAATVPITSRLSTVTNNSAATLTITITTASAVDGMLINIRVLDFSAVAQTITWVNTENSTVTAPVTSNGSTTLPVTTLFQYNAATSKWRCIASV
jgi:arsenate reductase-like glutaredoxin family protein